jgi:hypothetical protein
VDSGNFAAEGKRRLAWRLGGACLSYNITRLFSIRRKMANATVAAA